MSLLMTCLLVGAFVAMAQGQPAGSAPGPDLEALRRGRVALEAVYGMVEGDAARTPPVDQLFIASSADAWNAAGTPAASVRRAQEPGDAAPTLVARWSIPGDVLLNDTFEYKFTRGSWETVEVSAQGADTANRGRAARDLVREGKEWIVRVEIAGFADQRGSRWPAAKAASSVVGRLDVLAFTSTIRGNTRSIRVWTPPGYDAPENASRAYPVLYMHDGQNCFDAATSFSGEWRVDETMTALIEGGKVPPTIVVGIDNAGPDRGDEYTPIPIGDRMPGRGGKADQYLSMLVDEVIPMIQQKYRVLSGPEHTALGGSSFGGIISLTAAMRRPGIFGAVLAESPSLWIGAPQGRFLDMLCAHEGPWPRRMFMATGTLEYGDPSRDRPLQDMFKRASAALAARGLGDDRLRTMIEDGGRHHESTWARRLPAALEFLLGP